MLWEIIKKEFHSYVITARFVVGFIICLVLISASTYVAIEDYERRLSDYNVAVQEHRDKVLESKVYSEIRPMVDRRPNPLSIFSKGLDKRLANTFSAELSAVPMIYDGQKHGAYNPFLALFSSIDLAFVFQIVLSLLALLFAYDAISGEREGGTLKLIMSNPIPRSFILVGKYLSALLSLFWPIAVSIIISLLMIMLSGNITLTGAEFLRILLFAVVSLLYISLFYLIGLLISAKTHRASTSLMLSMFVWVFLTLIYPNAGGFLADRVIGTDLGMKQFSQISELWGEFNREKDEHRERIVPKHGVNGSSSSWASSSSNDEYLFYSMFEARAVNGKYNPESAVDALKKFYQRIEPMRIDTADRIWQIRKQTLNNSYGRKQRLAANIMRLSPASIYSNASTALAGTDLGNIHEFISQVREYRRNLIQYLNSQKAFSSEQWFRYGNWDTENKPNLGGVPVFYQRNESIISSIGRSVLDVLLLLFLNVIFFMLSYTFFMREEVR